MLTYQQARALEFIESEIKRTGGISPSHAEIAKAMNYQSKSAAHRVVTELVRRGFIERIKGRERSLAIIRSRRDLFPREKTAVYGFDEDLKILVPLEDYRAMKHQKSRKDEDSEIEKSRLG